MTLPGLKSGVRMRGWSLTMLARALVSCLVAVSVAAQTAGETHGTAVGAPPPKEPSAKIIIDSPLAEGLTRGAAVIHNRSENLRIAPLFGPAALSLSPRVGHLHVNVDDDPWVWAHTSSEPVIVVGLSPGPHKVRLQLMTANHQWLDEGAVMFTLPQRQMPRSAAKPSPKGVNRAAVQSIIIDDPLPEPLARGAVIIHYHIENLGVPIGYLRVRVDDTPWHWTDTTGSPIIVQGLAPGRHKILIEIANGSDQVFGHRTVGILVPIPHSQPEVR
jgi:hypothetical protein